MRSGALDRHLSAPERKLYEETRATASRHLAPIAHAGDAGRVNRPLVRALAENGLLPRLFAGGGAAALELCLIREALARHCTEAETAFAVQGLGLDPILQAARPELVDEWLPRIAAGEAIAAFALTEPGAGSDVAALSLAAEPGGEPELGYRLTGEKLWISNAPDADLYTVFARTAEDPRGGITAFAVPGDAGGLTGEPLELLSPHPIGRLRFQQVEVPPTSVIGEPGGGFRVAMRTLDRFRPSVGAFAIGMARAALDAACAHAATRHTFGSPLKDRQSISHRLADLTARVHAARLTVHDAARAHDEGTPDPALSAMAKLLATEAAQEAVDFAVQVHGAEALERGHPLEHLYRDVRAPRIYEGASEIQREIIARALFAGAGPS
ncbi:MAG TPA: acyl-CoA dehydrogenase family protein [Solirubrobacteraceae bacterium]|nr:acyl-CoA dehydrogenase family protein [Solirubrobacteraceae bacterium]